MIGSELAELLVAHNAKVTVADNLERGKLENLSAVRQHIKILVTDVSNFGQALDACAGQDVVFNLAAKVTSIEYNARHHADMFYKNMQLMLTPLEAASRAGVPLFVQASTVCVYPHDAPIPTPEDAADICRPEETNEGYGYAKLMGEKLAQWYAKEYGMAVAITRFANAYSDTRDYFDWETSHVVPALIRKCKEEEVIEIWGDGEQRREFLFAQDAAYASMLAAELGQGKGPINIGAGTNISINELLAKIQAIMGTNKPVKHIFTMPTGHRERMVDNQKLIELTGWKPKVDIDEGLKRTIGWYLSQ